MLRRRSWLLLGWSLPFLWLGHLRAQDGPGDWVAAFEFGARAMIGWTDHLGHTYRTGGLHLYANNPQLQIGPPPLLALATFQWAPIAAVTMAFSLLMLALGPVALRCLETCFPAQRRTTALLAGAVLMPLWAYWLAGYWRHLDDAFALTGVCAAMVFVNRQQPWLVGMLLGTGLASKPWAVVALPVLLGLQRQHRAKAFAITVAVAGAWWAPFLLAAPDTTSALGGFAILIDKGSVLSVLGAHGFAEGWLRPVQLDLGILVGAAVALRGDWRLAPLAGIAIRVAFDPYTWEYYAMGPVLLAAALDLRGTRTAPVWTLATAAAFFLPAGVLGNASDLSGLAKAVWVLAVLTAIALPQGLPRRAEHRVLATA